MMKSYQSRGRQFLALLALVAICALPALAEPAKSKKQKAYSLFDQAEKEREALNGQPAAERSRREYQRVMDAYRRVYYTSPTSAKASSAVVAVAELLAEMGRAFNDDRALRSAIGQYEFLRREYPGSGARFEALFTIGQIYREDLKDDAKAKETFQEFLKRYPRHHLAADAKEAIAEIDSPETAKKKAEKEPAPETPRISQEKSEPKSDLATITGIRHWSTPDYTRVAIDLESEVKYEAGRVPDPDRIFFDLQGTKLASTLVGKSFDVSDGFLKKIRVAQYDKGISRIVLDVDDVSDYSAFLLPNPYRLIIDIHGNPPQSSVAKKAEPKKNSKAESTTAKSEDSEPVKIAEQKKSDLKPWEKKAGPPTVTKTQPNEKAEAAKPNEVKKIIVEADPDPKEKAASKKEAAKKDSAAEDSDTSTKTELAKLEPPVKKATAKPTSEPIAESVAPRSKKAKKESELNAHQARPTSNGDTSLIRALGLKIGRIVVDAGHGGHDTGTIGPKGLLEKDLTLDVALRLGKLLENRLGAEVIYTRDDDTFVPLETRTAIANKEEADLFISIHANSSNDPSARGIETYYLNFSSSADALEVAARENAVSEKSIHELQDLVKKIAMKEKIEESREFAADVQRSLHSGLAAKVPAIRDRGVKKAPFIVLIGANMPSILAEISFLSNPTDERRLETPQYRQKIAEYLYRGISRYVNGLSGVKLASRTSKSDSGQ